jgi:7-cyano-7-deazaguanine synthase in queuosine biosynthesis
MGDPVVLKKPLPLYCVVKSFWNPFTTFTSPFTIHSLSRLEKLRLVADWDVAFQNFRVCLADVEDRLNCGKCEKCVQTITGLVAIGALDKTHAFF